MTLLGPVYPVILPVWTASDPDMGNASPADRMTIWKLVRTNVKNVRLGYMVAQPTNNVFTAMYLV